MVSESDGAAVFGAAVAPGRSAWQLAHLFRLSPFIDRHTSHFHLLAMALTAAVSASDGTVTAGAAAVGGAAAVLGRSAWQLAHLLRLSAFIDRHTSHFHLLAMAFTAAVSASDGAGADALGAAAAPGRSAWQLAHLAWLESFMERHT